MELLFIDESGDDGLAPKSSEFYILSGVAVEDIFWKETFWKLSRFRKSIVQKYGLKIDEIKGENIFQHEGPLYNSGLLPNDQKWIGESLVELIHKKLQVKIFVMAKSKEEFMRKFGKNGNKKGLETSPEAKFLLARPTPPHPTVRSGIKT